MLRGVLSPHPTDGRQTTPLILIVDIVDDMAHGTSSLTILVHFSIH